MPSLPNWSDPDRRDEALYRVAARLGRPDPLNRQELALLFLESHGVPHGLGAEWLGLTDATVKKYLHRARYKLAARNTPHAVATALRLGLIS